MKILFIGNGSGQFLINLCKWIKKTRQDWQLDLISDTYLPENAEIREYCGNVRFVDDRFFLAKVRILKALFYISSLRRLAGQLDSDYDACHLHYFSANYSFILKKIRDRCRRVIVTVYGSEFYRSPFFIKKLQGRVITRIDKFTFANKSTLTDFSRFFNIPENRVTLCRFGLSVLEKLKVVCETVPVQEARKKLGIPSDVITICCGYNASPWQRHVEVISSICRTLKTDYNILFLLPLTYGGNEKYKQEISDYVKSSGISAKLYFSFMTDDEVAMLRRATDIMINVQPTDQLSGSMQEHFFAGNLVIAGDWLPYQVFDDANIFYRKVRSVNDTGNEVKICIENFAHWSLKTSGNAGKIWDLSSWEKNIQNWLMLYPGESDL